MPLLLAATITAAHAGDGQWSFSTGANYTNGDYGEPQDTTILIAPVSLAYKTDWWAVRLTVPYVTIEGPGTIVPGSAGISAGGDNGGVLGTVGGLLDGLLGGGADAEDPPPSPATTIIKENGLGDVTFALAVVPWQSDGGSKATVTARVRAPTSDADRFLGIDDTALASRRP